MGEGQYKDDRLPQYSFEVKQYLVKAKGPPNSVVVSAPLPLPPHPPPGGNTSSRRPRRYLCGSPPVAPLTRRRARQRAPG